MDFIVNLPINSRGLDFVDKPTKTSNFIVGYMYQITDTIWDGFRSLSIKFGVEDRETLKDYFQSCQHFIVDHFQFTNQRDHLQVRFTFIQ